MVNWPAEISCDPSRLPAPEDDRDCAVRADIDRIGWSVMQVNPDNPGDDPLLWSFSVGLYYRFRHPEIILLGLAHSVAGQIINNIGTFVALGNKLVIGKKYGQFLGPECVFQQVALTNYAEYVGYARWFYRGSDFPMLQCVWPLKSGLYPWDREYPSAGAAHQPFLGGAQ